MSRRKGLITPRQEQVLALLARGQSNGDIAQRLGITEHTVEKHLRHIYKVLRAANRVQASAIYLMCMQRKEDSKDTGFPVLRKGRR